MTTLLIDADIFAYQACSNNEHAIKWDDDIWTLHSSEPQCIATFDDMITRLVEKSDCDKHILCFTDREHRNFRKERVSETYKANRKEVRKPLALHGLEKYAYANHRTARYPAMEADDVIGILATRYKGCVIYSQDKDLDQIPGIHWDGKERYTVTPEEGFKFFMRQTLTGDPTDGYNGCPGVGHVKADKLLQGDPKGFWSIVTKAYTSAGLTEEDALRQARMARLLTNELYQDGEIRLWQPTR